jgi:single-strand DNA-binding protein
MAAVNKAILLGNLGKDPIVRTLESGNKVANFSLATNRAYKGADGNLVEETEWHNIVLWGKLAELAEKFLVKGRQVYIEGRITNRQYDDKEGNKRYITEIVGENMVFVGGKDGGNAPSSKPSNEVSAMVNEPPVDDDLPF